MGKGNRGFKPQGIMNPMLMSRSRPVSTGPTIMERLNRASRPTWDDLKKLAHKKEKTSADFLEEWENEHYREELSKFRDVKRGQQEKSQLESLKEHAKSVRKIVAEKQQAAERAATSADRCPKPSRRVEGSEKSSQQHKRRKRKQSSYSSSDSSESSSSSDESRKSSRGSRKSSRGSRKSDASDDSTGFVSEDLEKIDRRKGADLEKIDRRKGEDLEKIDRKKGADLEKIDRRKGEDLEKIDRRKGRGERRKRPRRRRRDVSSSVEWSSTDEERNRKRRRSSQRKSAVDNPHRLSSFFQKMTPSTSRH